MNNYYFRLRKIKDEGCSRYRNEVETDIPLEDLSNGRMGKSLTIMLNTSEELFGKNSTAKINVQLRKIASGTFEIVSMESSR